MARHVAATVEEIPPGQRKIVEVGGRSIGIFNVSGEFFALRNRCPHQGGPLCHGPLEGRIESTGPGDYSVSRPGEVLRCPWHGWEFDIRKGQSWFDPARIRVRRYEVIVEPAGATAVGQTSHMPQRERGPYVAETYATAIEQSYIVIDIPE